MGQARPANFNVFSPFHAGLASWYREVKFSSQQHRYVDLCLTKFQPRANTPSIPFREGIMRASCGQNECIMTNCNRHGIEGGWNLVTHKSTYLCRCVENFSSLYQLWQASQASKYPLPVSTQYFYYLLNTNGEKSNSLISGASQASKF